MKRTFSSDIQTIKYLVVLEIYSGIDIVKGSSFRPSVCGTLCFKTIFFQHGYHHHYFHTHECRSWKYSLITVPQIFDKSSLHSGHIHCTFGNGTRFADTRTSTLRLPSTSWMERRHQCLVAVYAETIPHVWWSTYILYETLYLRVRIAVYLCVWGILHVHACKSTSMPSRAFNAISEISIKTKVVVKSLARNVRRNSLLVSYFIFLHARMEGYLRHVRVSLYAMLFRVI